MTKTRKQAEASGNSPKNLHGEDRAGSPLSGARRRSKSPKPSLPKPPPAQAQPTTTTTTPSNSEDNNGTEGQETSAVSPHLTTEVSEMEDIAAYAIKDALSTPQRQLTEDTAQVLAPTPVQESYAMVTIGKLDETIAPVTASLEELVQRMNAAAQRADEAAQESAINLANYATWTTTMMDRPNGLKSTDQELSARITDVDSRVDKLETTISTTIEERIKLSLSENNIKTTTTQNAVPAEVLVTNTATAAPINQPTTDQPSVHSKDPSGSHADEDHGTASSSRERKMPYEGIPKGPKGLPLLRPLSLASATIPQPGTPASAIPTALLLMWNKMMMKNRLGMNRMMILVKAGIIRAMMIGMHMMEMDKATTMDKAEIMARNMVMMDIGDTEIMAMAKEGIIPQTTILTADIVELILRPGTQGIRMPSTQDGILVLTLVDALVSRHWILMIMPYSGVDFRMKHNTLPS